jgi:8-oxo-dGTP pyrophosphatase MutT (NUDIX family)
MDARPTTPFSAADLRMRVADEDMPHARAGYGDHTLNPDMHEMIAGKRLRDAAVLIPVVDRGEEATVLLTQRAEKLRSHSGQVAFPGGRVDPTDASAEDAALRETFEEIGLPAQLIEVIGRLPDYVTGSGYRIVPVLGIVQPGFELVINDAEVDAAFEVPLGFLMNEANHKRESRVWLERKRFYYTMPYGDRFIWGATAGIIRTLYERLYA